MKQEIVVFEDYDALSRGAAERIREAAIRAVNSRKRFYLVLSGGGTPVETYRLLAEDGDQPAFPWLDTHVFWGDERCVPPEHPESNYGQARRILLDRVPIPKENIHRIRGELPAEEGAAHYRRELTGLAGVGNDWPVFDFTLLGLGSDGHIASLFPGDMAYEEQVAATPAKAAYEGRPAERVTLTPAIMNDSRLVVFLVSGVEKAKVVYESIEGKPNYVKYPAQRIRPENTSISWLVDEEAASLLNRRKYVEQ